MLNLHLDLSDARRHAMEERVQERGCATIDEYVTQLIAEDLGTSPDRELEKLLLQRIDDSNDIESTPAFWSDLQRRVDSILDAEP